MNDAFLWLTPVLALGVLLLAGFVGCQYVLGVHQFSDDNPLVVGENLMTPRNDYTGWVGMVVVPQGSDRVVYALGRFCIAGNSQTHDLKIVDAGTGADVPGSVTVVDLAGRPGNQFEYASLQPSVTLKANLKYYVLSHEISGGDQFYDFATIVQLSPDNVFTVPSAAYGDPTGSPSVAYTEMGGVDQAYGPVDLHYAKQI